MMGSSRGVVVGLAVVVALLAVAAGAAGLAGAEDDPGNETVEVDEGLYDLEELDHAGSRASESAPASMRQWGDAGSLWLRHVPSGIGGMESDPDTWDYLEAGETIERTEVFLGGSFGWGAGEELDVTIVYWDRESVPVTDSEGNTRHETIAANQEVRETNVTLGHSFAEEPVDLAASYDEPRHVTMMVEGDEGAAQWRFDVHTSRTAEPVAVNTRSDLAMWIGGVLGVTLLVVLASLYGARKFHAEAGAGPQYPIWLYGAALLPIGVLVLAVGYRQVLDTVATAPWILIPPLALITVLAAVSWWGDETRSVMVIDMDLADPSVQEDGSGTFDVGVHQFPLAEVGGHGREKTEGVVLEGISPYLARTRGAIPEWDIGGDPSVEYNAHGLADELVFTDPFDDDPIDFQREGWSFDHVYRPPDPEEIPDDAGTIDRLAIYAGGVAWMELLAAGGIVATGYVVGSVAFAAGLPGALVATIPAAMWVGRPVKGKCKVNAAPGAFGSVILQMITAGEELDDLADREFFKERYFAEKGQNVAERKQTREESELKKFDEVMGALEEGDSESLRDALPDDAVSGGASADD